jgi:hypothetical protein
LPAALALAGGIRCGATMYAGGAAAAGAAPEPAEPAEVVAPSDIGGGGVAEVVKAVEEVGTVRGCA